jgi:hypothetical protein
MWELNYTGSFDLFGLCSDMAPRPSYPKLFATTIRHELLERFPRYRGSKIASMGYLARQVENIYTTKTGLEVDKTVASVQVDDGD